MVQRYGGILIALVLIGAGNILCPMVFRISEASATEIVISGTNVARVPVAWDGTTSDDGVVVIAVSSFAPPETGGVEFSAMVSGPDGNAEIGRFALFPQTAFAAMSTADDRRFALTIPARFGRPNDILIRMVPFGGNGNGARATFRSARGSDP